MARWLLLLIVIDGPVGAPPLVLPVLRYIIITWTYIPTHYLHRNIQQHIRMYADNITVCCIHLTNYLHFLSHSSHTKDSAILLVRAFLDNTSQMVMIAGPACHN